MAKYSPGAILGNPPPPAATAVHWRSAPEVEEDRRDVVANGCPLQMPHKQRRHAHSAARSTGLKIQETRTTERCLDHVDRGADPCLTESSTGGASGSASLGHITDISCLSLCFARGREVVHEQMGGRRVAQGGVPFVAGWVPHGCAGCSVGAGWGPWRTGGLPRDGGRPMLLGGCLRRSPFIGSQFVVVPTGVTGAHRSTQLASYAAPHPLPRACG